MFSEEHSNVQEAVAVLFEYAKAQNKAIVVIDLAQSDGANNTSKNVEMTKEIIKITSNLSIEDDVAVVFTTSMPMNIDNTIESEIDSRIRVSLPCECLFFSIIL
jgi:hypothetical protein